MCGFIGGKNVLESGKYTETIHNMNAGQIWAAWKKQQLNAGQVASWQQRHNTFFNSEGKIINE